ncbi:MAG: rhodanese-like domain-containing protein [Burkholderiaceae bacterium]
MAFVTENWILIAIAIASGGMLAWPMLMGRAAAGAGLDPLAATRLINDRNPVVVDLRAAAEFAAGHLRGARNIPTDQLQRRSTELPQQRPVLLYCRSGVNSLRAVQALKRGGRDEVFTLTGGIQAWQQAGLPTIKT